MKVYISGPMRGCPMFNFPAFDDAADRLRAAGHTVFNPAEHDRLTFGDDVMPENSTERGMDARKVLIADVTWIAHFADLVVLLPGWRESRGAKAEAAFAAAIGVPCAEIDDL